MEPVTGSPLTPSTALPGRVRTTRLPQLARDQAGHHRAGSLAIRIDDVHSVRARLAVIDALR